MPPEQQHNSPEPTLVLILVLLVGAALKQGVFDQMLAQMAAMAALWLLVLALVGTVVTALGRLVRKLVSLRRKRVSRPLPETSGGA